MTKTESTVVSIVPIELKIDKPGIFPGRWVIPKADDDKPQKLVIGDSWHTIYVGVERGYLRVVDLSSDVARAIVEDFKRSIICTDSESEPGLFWLNRIINSFSEVSKELEEARKKQHNWYRKLVMMADDDWTKSGHMHRSVSDLQRLAAKKLNVDREWVYVSKDDDVGFKCPACRVIIDKNCIVCPNCKLVLKPDEMKVLTFAS